MNIFNEAIYKNHLKHTAAGTKWGKHKYLYITETGRYVYPEDIRNGQSAKQFRSRQINDQIKSAHSNATSSKMELTPGSELKKRAEARAASKTSGTAAGSKNVSSNTVTIKNPTTTTKTDDKNTTTNDGSKYKNMSEETKQWLMKNAGKDEKKEKKTGSGKKGGSGKKKGSSGKKSSKTDENKTETNSQTGTDTKKATTEESKQLGLADDDLKNVEINTEATNREEVIKNLALKVIRGDFGNGTDRKNKLGKFYGEIQKRVNEILKERKVIKHDDLEEGLFLKHFGNKNSGRYPRGSGDRPYQHEGRHTRKNSTFRDRRRMTDQELADAIVRVKKEVDLYRAERDNRSQGQRFVEDVLNSVGKAVIIGAATGGLKYAGKQFVSKALENPDLANAMFGGGGGKKKNKHKD